MNKKMKRYGASISVMYPTLDVKLASMLTYLTYSMAGNSAPLFHFFTQFSFIKR